MTFQLAVEDVHSEFLPVVIFNILVDLKLNYIRIIRVVNTI